MVIVEQLVEWRLAGETEILGENLPQCHFVDHKSHMTWHGLEPGPPRWETAWAVARPNISLVPQDSMYWLLCYQYQMS
jgi:hypothetical protein